MSKRVIVVGGGIAGLAAAIYLARAGRTVTLFEKRQSLGGRAITHLRRGFRFNLGPHAVYRDGEGARVYRELGIPVTGGSPRSRGIALYQGQRHSLPANLFSIATSTLLSGGGRLETVKLLLRIWRIRQGAGGSLTAREWLDRNVSNDRVRLLIEALMRVATYSDQAEEQSAEAALQQLRTAMRGVIYVDEGWQKLVDGLHSHAVAAGVNFVTSSRIVGVHHDGAVRAIEMGGLELEDRNDTLSVALPEIPPEGVEGARLPAEVVLLAVDPRTASELVGDGAPAGWQGLRPVTATCLDVALSRLPVPADTFALGIDRPLYFSVHSAAAQLTPHGGALIHVARYRKESAAIRDDELEAPRQVRESSGAAEAELEGVLDQIQPGWREVLVHRRFLPSMTVSNALVTPGLQRPAVRTGIGGLYVAGDWVGPTGLLSDTALASARDAASAILSES